VAQKTTVAAEPTPTPRPGRGRSRVLRTCVVAVVTAVAALGLSASPASAATCSASGCNGKNPETYKCSGDAKTISSATRYNGRIAQLRYSKKCKAVWVRTENGAAADMTIKAGFIDYYGDWHLQKSYKQSNGGAWASNNDPYYAWTPMISIHAYERYHYGADGSSWTWVNTKDGCPDSHC
jgi:hypothetical protein